MTTRKDVYKIIKSLNQPILYDVGSFIEIDNPCLGGNICFEFNADDILITICCL